MLTAVVSFWLRGANTLTFFAGQYIEYFTNNSFGLKLELIESICLFEALLLQTWLTLES